MLKTGDTCSLFSAAYCLVVGCTIAKRADGQQVLFRRRPGLCATWVFSPLGYLCHTAVMSETKYGSSDILSDLKCASLLIALASDGDRVWSNFFHPEWFLLASDGVTTNFRILEFFQIALAKFVQIGNRKTIISITSRWSVGLRRVSLIRSIRCSFWWKRQSRATASERKYSRVSFITSNVGWANMYSAARRWLCKQHQPIWFAIGNLALFRGLRRWVCKRLNNFSPIFSIFTNTS